MSVSTSEVNAIQPAKDPLGLLLAGGAGAIIGVLPALFAPVYSVWLSNIHELSNAQVGLVQSSLHIVQVAVILALSPIVARFNRKVLGVCGAFIAAIGYVLIAVSSGFWPLMAVQIVAGLGAGLAYVGATSALSYTNKPTRAFSIITIVSIFVGSITLIMFPALSEWSPKYGLFVGLVAMIIIGILASFAMPKLDELPTSASKVVAPHTLGHAVHATDGLADAAAEARVEASTIAKFAATSDDQDQAEPEKARSVFAFPGLAVIIAYFLINLGLVAVWTFSAHIGMDAGMSATASPIFLGVSQIMCIIGVLVAWYVGEKNVALPVLIASIIILSVGKFVLGLGILPLFIIGMLCLNFAFYCVIPYMFAAGAQLDPRSGRLVVMVGASAMIASAIGPAVGGYLAGSTDSWFRLTTVAAILAALAIPFAVAGVRAGLKAAGLEEAAAGLSND